MTTDMPDSDGDALGEGGFAKRFLRDVGGDYVHVHFLSKENALWLGVGGLAPLAVHPARRQSV